MNVSVILLALLLFGDLSEASKRYAGGPWIGTDGTSAKIRAKKPVHTEGAAHRTAESSGHTHITDTVNQVPGPRTEHQRRQSVLKFHDETEKTALRVQGIKRTKQLSPKATSPMGQELRQASLGMGPRPAPAASSLPLRLPLSFMPAAAKSAPQPPAVGERSTCPLSGNGPEPPMITLNQLPIQRSSPPPVRVLPSPPSKTASIEGGRPISSLPSTPARPSPMMYNETIVMRPAKWDAPIVHDVGSEEQQSGCTKVHGRPTVDLRSLGRPSVPEGQTSVNRVPPSPSVTVCRKTTTANIKREGCSFLAPLERSPHIEAPCWPPSQKTGYQPPTSTPKGATKPNSLKLTLDREGKLIRNQIVTQVSSEGNDKRFFPTKPRDKKFGECKLRDFTFIRAKAIGTGAFGAVFKAEHEATQTLVAIKVLTKDLYSKKPEAVKMEEYFLRKLNHPFLVGMHCSMIDEDETVYLVMEYIEGSDLGTQLRSGVRFDEAQLASILWQASQGLYHLHKKGVFHRDIKPSNMMMKSDGTLKIIDLGLAIMERGEGTKRAAGTPLYVAPEVARSRIDRDAPPHGRAADLYSLGLAMHHLATGRRHFDAGLEDREEVWKQRANQAEMVLPSTGYCGLDEAIALLLTHDPKIRWRQVFENFESGYMKLPIFAHTLQLTSLNGSPASLEHKPTGVDTLIHQAQ